MPPMTSNMTSTPTQKPQLNPALKLVLDLGPLLVFFGANSRFGIFAATGAFMAAIVIALAISYALTRHLPIMPLITAIVVLVFGGLTLVLHDELFYKTLRCAHETTRGKSARKDRALTPVWDQRPIGFH